MKRKIFLISAAIILLLIAFFVGSLFETPKAKSICFYPKTNADRNYSEQELDAQRSVCFNDKETFAIVNDFSRSYNFLEIWKGGFYGYFIDKNDQKHLIKIGIIGAVMLDETEGKKFTISNPAMVDKWSKLVNYDNLK